MPSPTKKTARSTGPKSKQGKAKSSLNAVSHGLTSNRVLPDEIQMVEDFSQELAQYYKPESPLEILQIQRIAFSRAKLAKLIDIEIAGREIARKEIENHPEKVMSKLIQYPQYLRSMVLQDMTKQSILDGFSLTRKELIAICQEVSEFLDLLEGEDDLPSSFPKLCAYLRKTPQSPEQLPDISLDQRLMMFAQRIRSLHINDLMNSLPDSSIEALWRRVHESDQIDKMAQRKILRQKAPGNTGYHKAVEIDLMEIKNLNLAISQFPAVIQSFEEMKSWMLRSIDLSADESERMMKYQTMLERRLSTAIGELLELQRHKLKLI